MTIINDDIFYEVVQTESVLKVQFSVIDELYYPWLQSVPSHLQVWLL